MKEKLFPMQCNTTIKLGNMLTFNKFGYIRNRRWGDDVYAIAAEDAKSGKSTSKRTFIKCYVFPNPGETYFTAGKATFTKEDINRPAHTEDDGTIVFPNGPKR